jgi:hypothetical protein
MTTRARSRRDLSWPVPATDLQDLDVIEILKGDDGQVLWRVDEQPAAAPQDCREALLKRRHVDEADSEAERTAVAEAVPDALPVLLPTIVPEPAGHRPPWYDPHIESGDIVPAADEMPEVPASIAVPDRPGELPDADDVTRAMQWREDFASLDAPVLHVVQVPPEVHAAPASHATPDPARESLLAQFLHIADVRPEARADDATLPPLLREWPQVVEFVDAVDYMEPAQPVQMGGVADSRVASDAPVEDAIESAVPDAGAAVTLPASRPSGVSATVAGWAAAVRDTLERARVAPAERLALVGGGMLMGVLFGIVGGPRVPVTTSVAASDTAALHVSSLAPAEVPAASPVVPERLVAVGRVVENVPPRPMAMPADTIANRAEMPAIPRAAPPRPEPAPAVLGAIRRFTAAYNRQDARATAAVWPSADRQALVKAFNGLREQRLTWLSCTTDVTGNQATASCVGTRRYRPRVGDSSTRIQQGRWRFGLQRSAGTWLIASVSAP